MKIRYSVFVVLTMLLVAAPVAAQERQSAPCASVAGPNHSICIVAASATSAVKPGGLAQPVAAMNERLAGQASGTEPGAGAWHTWVLESGSELQLEPPPSIQATRDELRELRMLAGQRDAVALDQTGTGSPPRC
jgi:hypothetical protein